MTKIKEKSRPHNSRLLQWGQTCKIEGLYFYQTFVQVDSEVLRNPSLWQAAKRLAQNKQTGENLKIQH